MNKISIVVPTYNSIQTLIPCLRSLTSQTLKPYEIIVINNASTDNTQKVVEKKFPRTKLVTLGKNLGVTGGRNKGIAMADKSADAILFFDHDMVAEKNMLKELAELLCSDGKIGITTPKIYYASDKKKIWSAGTGINLWTGQVLFRGGKDSRQYDSPEEVQVAPAALLVRKEVVKKLKGYDDTYYATFEDTDFCFRANREGFQTWYTPNALAWHDISTDPNDEADRLLRRSYYVGKNRVIFMKEFGKPTFWLFLPVFFLHYLLLALKYRRFGDGLRFITGTISGILH